MTKKLSEKDIIQLEGLASVLNMEQIAHFYGMTRKTLYSVMERQPEAEIAMRKGKAKAIAAIGRSLILQAKEGNTAAMMFYLKTQAGWRETNHTVLGSDGTLPDQKEKVEIKIIAKK
ncbi:MAG TPA: hypothetical protein VK982_09635 [Bacteroidales bacterium]|nr:hypothetical protein [Bacteroidales bacterium]